jgi:hypothetical protein
VPLISSIHSLHFSERTNPSTPPWGEDNPNEEKKEENVEKEKEEEKKEEEEEEDEEDTFHAPIVDGRNVRWRYFIV